MRMASLPTGFVRDLQPFRFIVGLATEPPGREPVPSGGFRESLGCEEGTLGCEEGTEGQPGGVFASAQK